MGRGDRLSRNVLLTSAAIFVVSACASLPKPAKPLDDFPPDSSIVGFQNWSPEQQQAWWEGSQGSRLIPKAWLDALEAPDSQTLFMAAEHFDRFGYIKENPGDRYPIGFAADDQSDKHLEATALRWYAGQGDREPWIGLNCAACHTNRITYGTFERIVDGAPTLADFQGFTDALLKSMEQTSSDDAKWKRFAARVLSKSPSTAGTAADEPMLKSSFNRLLDHQRILHKYNETKIAYGHGRLDAVGHILNKVAMLNGAPASFRGQVGARQFRGEPDAPVSYPFLWNVAQHDFVQWNGIVPNQKIPHGKKELDIGALVRNTSEVIGVFAEVRPRRFADWEGYRSSVRIDNLTRMEAQLKGLMSPAWPAEFGPVDSRMAERGRDTFLRACADCHAPLNRKDLDTPIKAHMTPIWGPGGVGTDPGMVCNAYTYQARAGLLQGTKQKIVDGDPLPAIAPTATFLQTQAVGVLLRDKIKILLVGFRTLLGFQPRIAVDRELEAAIRPGLVPPVDQPKTREQRLADCIAAANSPRTPPGDLRILAYKARPLNGIWATAPYLHNGSVRTLYQLLLPQSQRQASFWVGSREFDPKEVGFVDKKLESGFSSEFSTVDAQGKPIRGNSNEGHNYQFFDENGPRDLTEKERWELVEYMKTL